MNVYDFDETIFYTNSTVSVAIWCMNKNPMLWVKLSPRIASALFKYISGKMPAYLLMRNIFSLFRHIDNLEEEVEKYWDKHEKDISAWYLKQKKPDDLIISASPTFIIEPIARRLGVKFVATEYDRESGVFLNNLMYAKEKSRYIIDNDFPVIENFYSDSLSDTPIALCAEKAHLVINRAQKVIDWPHLDEKTMKKVQSKINTGWRIHI